VSGESDLRPDEPPMRSSPEFDLLAAIRGRMGATRASHDGAPVAVGIGDDAAVTIPGGAIAVSVDALVEGVGFRRAWCPPRAIGHKALGAALSDLAAMGARGGEAYVWVGAPREFGDAECLELCDGIAALASEQGVAVLGGDLTAAGEISVCVTAIGHARLADDLIGREGAEPGFSLCVTGSLGGAAAGLMLLEHAELGAEVGESARDAAISRQLSPVPRLAAGVALARSGVRAMIDVSDGLGADAEHLAAASGLGIEIELGLVPVGDGVREVALAAGRDPSELVASGGEDYELLCAVPRAALGECRAAVRVSGSTLTEIGRFVDGGSVRLRLPGGRSVPADGHDQRRGR
jgi:thiamine-monophosphate kinase